MGFITGFIVGVISVLVILPLISKPIMAYAAKRKLNNLMSGIMDANKQFENVMKDNSGTEKEAEQTPVKEENGTKTDN